MTVQRQEGEGIKPRARENYKQSDVMEDILYGLRQPHQLFNV